MRTSRQWIGFASLACMFLAAAAIYFFQHHEAATAVRRGPDADFLPEAYIWQRAWTDPLRRAVPAEAPAFSRLVVLAAQIDFRRSPPRVIDIPVDWPILAAAETPLAAAIRIGPYTGPFPGPASDLVCQTVSKILAAARAHHINLTEIQFDFDASTSRLADYRAWLAAARKIAGPIPVTFTALPTWLDSPAFAPLAKDAGYFVLQVHWLEHPHRLGDPLVLCDLAAARRAIEKSARLNVPFRVALPTYSYLAAYNPDGSFAGLAAESAPPNWAQNKIIRRIAANPNELAAFVNEFARVRPISMRGFIWYRLPIDSDRLNWSFATLQCVLAGKIPPPGKLNVTCEKSAENLYDIHLQNVGLQDIDPAAIRITWSHAALVAADALDDFTITAQDRSSLSASPSPESMTGQSPLKPHESRTIAWLRFNKEPQIHAAILQTSPAVSASHDDVSPR